MKELFLGNFRADLVHPYPLIDASGRSSTPSTTLSASSWSTEVDPEAIDATGEYPPHVLDGLRKLGAFGLKIPKEYGGLGFTMLEYSKLMELLGSVDGNVEALLSAHQSIGVPTPLLISAPRSRSAASCRAAPRARSPRSPSPRGRRLRPGPARDHRRALGRAARTTCSTGSSSGARTARSLTSWWSWPGARILRATRRSPPSWSR